MTNIEWTDAVWNPVTGCDRVSPGCAHCYALTLAKRLKAMGVAAYQRDGGPASGPGFGVTLHPERLDIPLRWKRPRRVFVNSMSDLFHEEVPDWFIYAIWSVMFQTPQHTYQILTKRPQRMRAWMAKWCDRGPSDVQPVMWRESGRGHPWSSFVTEEQALSVHNAGRSQMFHAWVDSWGELPLGAARPTYDWMEGPRWWPTILGNVWLGVSAENQRWADARIPILLDTPAAVRFLSAEPLLGPISLRGWETYDHGMGDSIGKMVPRIDWVIVGGESGPKHRPFDPDWARSIRDQCRAAGVSLFVKQLGGARPGTKLEDLPADLRIREYPR